MFQERFRKLSIVPEIVVEIKVECRAYNVLTIEMTHGCWGNNDNKTTANGKYKEVT